MKRRFGWVVTWTDGTRWFGDCPRWAEKCRAVSLTENSNIKTIGRALYLTSNPACTDSNCNH